MTPATPSDIIVQLIYARHKLGLSQRALAERMATHQGTVSRIEQNRSGGRLETILRYAEAVNCEIWVVPRDTDSIYYRPVAPP